MLSLSGAISLPLPGDSLPVLAEVGSLLVPLPVPIRHPGPTTGLCIFGSAVCTTSTRETPFCSAHHLHTEPGRCREESSFFQAQPTLTHSLGRAMASTGRLQCVTAVQHQADDAPGNEPGHSSPPHSTGYSRSHHRRDCPAGGGRDQK